MGIRHVFVRLAAVIVLGGAASGCVMTDWRDYPPLPQPASACFWMTQDGSRWEAMAGVPNKQACFELDSCSGGQGQSGGGCYKWASGPDAKGEKW
jgi:hypothetical protein